MTNETKLIRYPMTDEWSGDSIFCYYCDDADKVIKNLLDKVEKGKKRIKFLENKCEKLKNELSARNDAEDFMM